MKRTYYGRLTAALLVGFAVVYFGLTFFSTPLIAAEVGYAYTIPAAAVAFWVYVQEIFIRDEKDPYSFRLGDVVATGFAGLCFTLLADRGFRMWARLRDVYLDDNYISLFTFMTVAFLLMMIAIRGDVDEEGGIWSAKRLIIMIGIIGTVGAVFVVLYRTLFD